MRKYKYFFDFPAILTFAWYLFMVSSKTNYYTTVTALIFPATAPRFKSTRAARGRGSHVPRGSGHHGGCSITAQHSPPGQHPWAGLCGLPLLATFPTQPPFSPPPRSSCRLAASRALTWPPLSLLPSTFFSTLRPAPPPHPHRHTGLPLGPLVSELQDTCTSPSHA